MKQCLASSIGTTIVHDGDRRDGDAPSPVYDRVVSGLPPVGQQEAA